MSAYLVPFPPGWSDGAAITIDFYLPPTLCCRAVLHPSTSAALLCNEDIHSKVIVWCKISVRFFAYRKLCEINESE